MWLCAFPSYPKCGLIECSFISNYGIGAIRIWNYNRSSIDTTKGVKELEIFVNGNPKWFGTINRGSGNDY